MSRLRKSTPCEPPVLCVCAVSAPRRWACLVPDEGFQKGLTAAYFSILQRNKHLKCDGQTPCSRCITSGYECVYVASRRGYKGPRRGASQNPNKRQATSPPEIGSGGADCPMLLGATVSGPMAAVPGVVMPGVPPGYTSPHGITSDQLYQSYRTATGMDPSNGAMTRYSTSVPALAPPRTLDEKCIDSFYFFFHGGHPFVLPKDHLLRKAKEGTIEPLLAAMKWAGSLYIDVAASRPTLYDKAMRLILDPQQPENGFLLQAMMVLIVALDGTCQNEKARELLGEAERMALGIDINTRPFATLHGEGLPVLEESWRRTWWDLFVIDGMIAGVHRVTNFLLFDVPTDVGLPCEEQEYLSGVSGQNQAKHFPARIDTDFPYRTSRLPCTWASLRIASLPEKSVSSPPSRTASSAAET